jgi:hypothetical protein
MRIPKDHQGFNQLTMILGCVVQEVEVTVVDVVRIRDTDTWASEAIVNAN